jgi:glycosyltransferase involved in cell wall biosynthesis
MRIAMIGLRGLPATFGGIERHVEELGTRLVARGHEVVVFCRPQYVGDSRTEYRGVRLVQVPTPARVGAEAFVHSALSTVVARRRDFDVAHFHALGPGLFSPLARVKGLAVVQTVHGLDHQRAKWGPVASTVLALGAHVSARVPHEVVVVSEELRRHYDAEYHRATTYIGNGVPEPGPGSPEVLARFGLREGEYALFVGRLVPEKDPALLIRAFRQLADTSQRLVLVGDSSHTDEYTAELKESARGDDRIVFTGFQYGAELESLYQHAGLFVQPSLLEGLPITLLEAAAHGVPVLVSDIPPHLEVLRETGPGRATFTTGDEGSLVAALRASLADEGAAEGARRLHDEVVQRYSWDQATTQLEDVYTRAVAGAGQGRRRRA